MYNSHLRCVHRPLCENSIKTPGPFRSSGNGSEHCWCLRWVPEEFILTILWGPPQPCLTGEKTEAHRGLVTGPWVIYLLIWLEFHSRSNFISFPSPIHCEILHQNNVFSLSFKMHLYLSRVLYIDIPTGISDRKFFQLAPRFHLWVFFFLIFFLLILDQNFSHAVSILLNALLIYILYIFMKISSTRITAIT